MTTMPLRPSRRSFLRALGATALALPFYDLVRPRRARAGGAAKRVIFFYFPDGVSMTGGPGDASHWHPAGSEHDFTLSHQLEPLAAFQDDCVLLGGLTMNLGDGSHDEGARKLLTGRFGGISIDQHLAGSIGKESPFPLLYLGAMCTRDPKASHYVSQQGGDVPATPIEDPRKAFESLFGAPVGTSGDPGDARAASVIDGAMADLEALRAELGGVEAQKLDAHLDGLRELEKRVHAGPIASASCLEPSLDTSGFTSADLAPPFHASALPHVLRAQMDLMVLAMACGLTRVGTLQLFHHTAEDVTMAFPSTELEAVTPMYSHSASHNAEDVHIAQRRWIVAQLAYLLGRLRATPEPDDSGASMLDTSLVLACTEVASGPQHTHYDMPFVLAGRAGGALPTGRLLRYDSHAHSDLLTSIAHAMGDPIASFGESAAGPLPGLLA
jgi:hypothetical protein